MLNSVRTRLTFWYTGVVAVVLVVFSVGVYALINRNTHRRVDTELQSTMEGTARLLVSELTERELDVAAVKSESPDEDDEPRGEVVESIEDLSLGVLRDRYLPHQSAAVFDSGGRLIAEQLARDDVSRQLTVPLSAFADQLNLRTESEAPEKDDDERRLAFQRVTMPSGDAYLIVVSQSLRPAKEELGTLRGIFYVAVPAALALAWMGGWWLARKSLGPVVKMSDAARRMGADKLEQRLPVANPRDELGQLAVTFNELLSRLNAAFAQQRQFMADASHELRTPLSVMNTTAQVTLEKASRDEAEYREAITIMAEQTRRLARIVEDMFMLARADAGRRELQETSFYLDELIAETVIAARILAARKGVTLAFAQPAETPYFGDEELLRQMVLNLLDNAIRHTPRAGTVSVQLSHEDSSHLITVSDTGGGIPPEAQPHIFERFYQADKSRTRASGVNGGSGAGLGLSIGRWIAEAHEGRLDLRSSDHRGTVFAVTLPVRRAN
ncbi:MAG TPA: ATP-binding protein [Blastocatellia bacterium]|nr:ATP-binding protein [Blastocatellia bacterium]